MSTEQGRASVPFTTIRTLTAVYVAATTATTVFLAWRHDDHTIATDHAWGHAVIVLGFAIFMVAVAQRAAQGSRRALVRLRIISVMIPVASVILVAIPEFLPAWMRIEQAIYGVLLLVIAGLSAKAPLRSAARRP